MSNSKQPDECEITIALSLISSRPSWAYNLTRRSCPVRVQVQSRPVFATTQTSTVLPQWERQPAIPTRPALSSRSLKQTLIVNYVTSRESVTLAAAPHAAVPAFILVASGYAK